VEDRKISPGVPRAGVYIWERVGDPTN
jgi:hypothetical protein